MYHWMDSGGWFWVTFVMVVLVGAVVYVAVKLAKRPQTDPKSHG